MEDQPCSLLSSPFSSPNVSALLKIKIHSWTKETGLPVCIRVRIAGKTFNLHKLPLSGKSGYLKEKLEESNEVDLPGNFPGGADTFEMIALFMYGCSTLVDTFNVGALRCAAQFLRMPELSDRFDIYLNQVVLQNWTDTLIVLQNCRTLLPWAEDVVIISRCIESLSFMACMEILDPDRSPDHAVVAFKDLTALPLPFFKRVIASLRRQGMKEKYVGPIVAMYTHTWAQRSGDSELVRGVVDLLPDTPLPVALYLSLLSGSVKAHLSGDRVEKLQNEVVSLLHMARPEDFVCVELCIMQSIFSKYFNRNMPSDSYVAKLWDLYLKDIATDPQITCDIFVTLIEIVPLSIRQTHDHLYRAVHTFFQCHPDLSQEEKAKVCKYLNCNKLSQQVCIEAVQNEVMPLRLIVQALFVQQLNTHQAFKECSESFRCGAAGDLSELTSSGYANSSPRAINHSSEGNSRPLGLLLQNDTWEYESTSFRIQNLEKEVMCLKRSLKRRSDSKKIKHVSNCIGSLSFGSHRRYANRILKILQRLTLFGRSKSKPSPGHL